MSTQNMRIGFDAKRLFTNFSGLGEYSRSLLKNLQKLFPQHLYFLFTPNIVIRQETQYFLNHPGFKIIEYSNKNKLLGKIPLLESFWRLHGIKKNLIKNQIQLYHGLSNELPVGIHQTGIKTIVTIHDLLPFRYPSDFNWIDRNIYKRKIRLAVKHANAMVCVSKSTLNDCNHFLQINEDRLNLIYPCVQKRIPGKDSSIENPILRKINGEYFLFAGANQKRKNLLTALKAFAMLNDQRVRKISLLVTGYVNTKLQKMYTREIVRLNIHSSILFVGDVNESDLALLYKNARGLIFLSLYEGFGLPRIEAILAGIPVISSRNSSLTELAEKETIYLDNAENPVELAIQMQNILESTVKMDPSFELEVLKPEYVAGQYIKLYAKLLEND